MDDSIESRIAARVRAELEPVLRKLVTSPPVPVTDDAGICQLLGVSRPTLRRMLDQGLPFLAVGDVRRYRPAAVVEWCEQRAKEGR